MAFPTTISTGARANERGCGGPFLSSAGYVYVLLNDDTTTANIRAFKATDPTSSFSNVGTDFAVTSGNDVFYIDAVQDGDTLHVVTVDSSSSPLTDIRYHVFDMSSDTWTTTNETIKNDATPVAAANLRARIALRSDGDIIVLYNGTDAASMGTDYNRVYYARKESGSWTIDVAVDNGGAANWYAGGIVVGSSDRMHFYFGNDTGSAAYQRCLTSANALQAFPSAFDATANSLLESVICQRGTSYDDSGTQRVRYPSIDSTISVLNSAKCDSADTPTMSLDADITGTLTGAGAIHRASFSADGTTLYLAWVNSGNSDIYTTSNADDAGWPTTPTVFYTGTCTSVFTNIYQRGNDVVLAMVFVETDPKYTESVLRTVSSYTSADASITATASATWNGKSTAASNLNQAATAALTWNGAANSASAL